MKKSVRDINDTKRLDDGFYGTPRIISIIIENMSYRNPARFERNFESLERQSLRLLITKKGVLTPK